MEDQRKAGREKREEGRGRGKRSLLREGAKDSNNGHGNNTNHNILSSVRV